MLVGMDGGTCNAVDEHGGHCLVPACTAASHDEARGQSGYRIRTAVDVDMDMDVDADADMDVYRIRTAEEQLDLLLGLGRVERMRELTELRLVDPTTTSRVEL